MDTLIFQIGGRRYGLPAPNVRELFRAVTITAITSGPALLEGVIDLRGSVVPVFDLRARLGLPPKAAEAADHLIVIELRGSRMVLRADQALEMATINEGEIGCLGDVAHSLESLVKVAKRPEGLVLLLDLETLVSPLEHASIEENLSLLRPSAEEEPS